MIDRKWQLKFTNLSSKNTT